jgi:phosphatidylglycerol:prolipoprotein diacylglycerol transferase
MLSFINFPSWLKPEIINGLPIRWYGLMYIIAFFLTYIFFKKQVKEKELKINDDVIANLFFWGILGILLGARIFSALVYDRSGDYIRNPFLIFWPFDKNFNFTGLQGMSYHGGLAGVIVAVIIFCKKKKLNFFLITDMLVAAAPLGYTFGRLGNFINGELFGRVTAAPWGILFPYADPFSVKENWVAEIATKAGMDISNIQSYINLPRHPSQLYEAFFEGLFLWAFLWFILRKKKFPTGTVTGVYIAGYGFVRFFIEYFREPDKDLGFIINLVKPSTIHKFDSFFNFSMGQLFCFIMITAGISLICYFNKKANKIKK